MFDNIGGKIKGLAKFIYWVGFIISVIAGISILLGGASISNSFGVSGLPVFFVGLAVIAIGSLLSWVGSLTLYGFGELVENSTYCAEALKIQKGTLRDIRESISDINQAGPANTDPETIGTEEEKFEMPKFPPRPVAPGPRSDIYGWKLSEDEKFVFCPVCNERYSVDYMKTRNSCKECGAIRKKV